MQAGERKLLISVWRCESLLQSDMCYFCQMARNANLFFSGWGIVLEGFSMHKLYFIRYNSS